MDVKKRKFLTPNLSLLEIGYLLVKIHIHQTLHSLLYLQRKEGTSIFEVCNQQKSLMLRCQMLGKFVCGNKMVKTTNFGFGMATTF